MATTPKNTPVNDATEEVSEVTVPHQKGTEKSDVVSLTVVQDVEENDSMGDKLKRLVRNKKVVASAATSALLTIAVFIIRQRNSREIVVNPEDEKTSS